MKRFTFLLSISIATFSISVCIVAFWILNRPLPTVDLPQNLLECASEPATETSSRYSAERVKFIARFREFPLNKPQANADESYRLIWIPTFHNPTVIRIWRSGESYFIATKRLSRNKNNLKIGDLKFEQSRSLTAEKWHSFVKLLSQSCFWNTASTIKEELVEDGASWALEGYSNGQYHFVDRITPSQQMSKIFRNLFKLTDVELEYESYL